MFKSLIYFTAGCMVFMSEFSGATSSESELSHHRINESLYVILGGNGKGSHVGVSVGDKSVVLIDAMLEASSQRLLKAVKSISDKPVKYLINTHDHFDHTGGNALFESRGATIVSQESSHYDKPFSLIRFEKKLTLSGNTEEIAMLHVSSHSSSDAIVYFKNSNVIFMGDVFETGWYPSFFYGGISGYNKAIDQVLALADEKTIIVPGHGDISNRKDLLVHREDSNLWVKRIMALHNSGMEIDNIIKDKELNMIRKRFIRPRTNQEGFNKMFPMLVENTIKVETGVEM